MKPVKFRSSSIFGERRQVPSPKFEPIVGESVVGSPRALGPTETEGRPPPVPAPKEATPPAVGMHSANEAGLGVSYDGPKPTIKEEHMFTANISTVTNQPRTPLTKEQHFKKSAIASHLVYRVQGIPINYQMVYIKKLLRSKFELDPSMDIYIRSLAVSQDQRRWTVVVSFINAPPSATSPKENDWSFKWYLENEKAIYIKIDTHFIGLTMLYTPGNAEHEIE